MILFGDIPGGHAAGMFAPDRDANMLLFQADMLKLHGRRAIGEI